MTDDIAIGTEIRSLPRRMTRERMRWYVDGQPTIAADDGRIHTQPPTIHDDDAYARSQGLPGIIADGMVSTNWLLGLMIDRFGPEIVTRCKFNTKYVAPIYEDQMVISCLKVTDIGADSIVLDIWCEDDHKTILTVGKATLPFTR